MIRYGSVCSGIEAASVAWHSLGWRPAWFAEIEPFPSAVLAHHFPDVPNLGDMTAIAGGILGGTVETIDALVGGTPCQAFSLAGLRDGLSDARGQLTLSFVELANANDLVRARREEAPAVIVWENVPGVLSSKDNAFGCFIGALAGEDCPLDPPGGKWTNAGCVYGPARAIAWRVLDAQYFGVAQRRRRVFVVASARKGFDPAAVLFEREGLRRDNAPRRDPAARIAGTLTSGSGGGCGPDDNDARAGHLIAGALTCGNRGISADQAAASMIVPTTIGTLAGTSPGGGWRVGADEAAAGQLIPVAFGSNTRTPLDFAPTLTAHPGRMDFDTEAFVLGQYTSGVRRLLPVECERLQGFPDFWTLVPFRGKPASDGPRFKALGNSMAVPCMAWIGRRVANETALPAR